MRNPLFCFYGNNSEMICCGNNVKEFFSAAMLIETGSKKFEMPG